MSATKRAQTPAAVRAALVAVLIVAAFFVAYRVVSGTPGAAFADGSDPVATQAAFGTGDAGTDPACACCGNAGTGEPIEGAAVLEGDVQRITVDTANGYDPNVIKLATGVPTEITFKQGSGCMAEVMSQELGFFEDLTNGDVTITLPPLEPGEYRFSCGMSMVFGTIVVE
ncbi:MAG: hypothetical protein Kow0067_12110 [Coriobacteriia bacterium]